MPNYELDPSDRDIVRMALRGDVDLRRYVPEVMRCARGYASVNRLGLTMTRPSRNESR
ncbi:MAG: hypothetical protein ABWY12_03395 [Burkholderiales bacterium]